MATIDQQFVEYIVKTLVSHPDDVTVERTIDEKGVLLKLTVNGEDLGRVIGKRGSTAQSIRTLLRALGTKNDARYNLKIVDPEGGNSGSSVAATDDSRVKAADDHNSTPDEGDESTGGDEEPKDKADSAEDTGEAGSAEAAGDNTAEETESLAAKTRKELAELDDLDL